MPRAKRLTNLDVDEISGVDHPAHLMEGWVVMKAAGTCPECEEAQGECSCGHMHKERQVQMDEHELEAILEKAEQYQAAHEELATALDSTDEFLDDAPEDVREAVDTISSHLDVVLERTPDVKKERKNRLGSFIKNVFNLEKNDTPSDEVEDLDDDVEFIDDISDLGPEWEPVDVENIVTEEDVVKAWDVVCKAVANGDAEGVEAAVVENIAPLMEENEVMEELVKALVDKLNEAVEFNKAADEEFAKAEDNNALREALTKALERIEALEVGTAVRKGVDGQEDVEVTKSNEDPLDAAVRKAFGGQRITIQ